MKPAKNRQRTGKVRALGGRSLFENGDGLLCQSIALLRPVGLADEAGFHKELQPIPYRADV
jgi:hypothetical protein